MTKSTVRTLAAVVGSAAIVVTAWMFWSLHRRLLMVETMAQILLTVQPGAKLADVEQELGAEARRCEPGQKPTTDFPLDLRPTDYVATFDSYLLPEFQGVMDFWVVVDKQDRVVTMHVLSYPIDWNPTKRKRLQRVP